jgi:3'-phosphoadenosine 5'-phosphosulfate (PAPS) 3'-phosphatase
MDYLTLNQHAELSAAVRHAGDLLLSLWPGREQLDIEASTALKTASKADGSPVTQADLLSNQILIGALNKLFPNDAILSEESPFESGELERSKRTWIIDPLDGTRSFVNGEDDFSILVALCENFIPVYGIMFFPVQSKFVTAGRSGEGSNNRALFADALCNGGTLSVSRAAELHPGRIYIRNFECKRPELASPMMDSGAALLKVANGELDGAIIRMTTHREWDIAAPAVVIEAAGGTVTDETMSLIRFGRGRIDFKYLIASNGSVHQELQGLIP